jgi:hypothetical protein
MKVPKFARNKTEAAKLAGISRTTLYQLMRMPGFPSPRADGRWSVAAIRKFALQSAKKLEGPQERDRLQLDLLNLKIQRASQELTDFEKELREKVLQEAGGKFSRGFQTMVIRLDRLPQELAGRLAELDHPGEIRKLLKSRLDEARRAAVTEFKSYLREQEAKESGVIVPFDERKVSSA